MACPDDLYVRFDNGNVPIGGDSDLDIYVFYRVVKVVVNPPLA